MSASTTTQTLATPSETRAKRGNRGRGRGGHRGGPNPNKAERKGNKVTPTTTEGPAPFAHTNDVQLTNDGNATATTKADEDAPAVCWICAEPVKYYSLSACNHRTCHVCALRLRALYKKLECTFCKEPQATVIFTTSPDAEFSSYTPDTIPFKDAKLAIFFETEDMMEETLILLRFNCPDSECAYTASGWGDLKLHVRAMHGKMLCDLCIRSKKVFAHEHALYPPNVLQLHLPSIPHRPNKQLPKDPVEGGTHPLCEFCCECFFDDDELFVHMRERHEECFICKRNEIRDQYFQNYESLEFHFWRAHFACMNAVCQAQKFVVFDSELDLKAHQVDVHGADMTSKDKKEARRVLAEFEFEDTGGSGRRGRRGDREREREPPPQPTQALGRPGGRRQPFGGHLTTAAEGTSVTQPITPPLPSGRMSPLREDVDPIVAERQAAFISRLQNVAPNPNNAVAAVKAAMRGYRANESSARDLISTVWNVLDHNLDDTASIINGVVDLLEEEEKKRDLLAAWNGFKIEHRQQFPDLVPTAVGSGYAGIASGRVLNAKRAAASRSSQQSSRQVLDRVARAASSSSSAVHVNRFPPLAAAAAPAFRQPVRHTPWTGASSSGSGLPTSGPAAVASIPTLAATVSPRKGKAAGRPPLLSDAAFPELPTAQPRQKPVVGGNASLRNIVGDATPTTSAWKANGNEQAGETSAETPTVAPAEGGKGKKGKGKQKQTLFTLGSFPA